MAICHLHPQIVYRWHAVAVVGTTVHRDIQRSITHAKSAMPVQFCTQNSEGDIHTGVGVEGQVVGEGLGEAVNEVALLLAHLLAHLQERLHEALRLRRLDQEPAGPSPSVTTMTQQIQP